MSQNLQTVLELQLALSQLRDAERRLHGIPDWMRELHEEHTVRKSEIDSLQEAVESAGHERRTAEAASEDIQEKLKKYQQQINKVSTQREYGALLQEIDTVKGQISGFEEQGISALDRVEKAETDLAEKREAFRELADRYATELARWEGEKPGVQRQVEELQARITSLRADLPRNVTAMFDRILERYPAGALAAVRPLERPGRLQREWHCTACNYRVRPQSVVEIRNTESLVQCDSCKRILYLEPAEVL
jgi:predicted  nucleic acid-binding Zn-ribbon protein